MGNGRTDMNKASVHRRSDAEVLFKKQRFRGAMYMAGYAVECKLKAALMFAHHAITLEELEAKLGSDLKIHSLERLASRFLGRTRVPPSVELKKNWGIVRAWSVAWRYDRELDDPDVAAQFLRSVDWVLRWLENNA